MSTVALSGKEAVGGALNCGRSRGLRVGRVLSERRERVPCLQEALACGNEGQLSTGTVGLSLAPSDALYQQWNLFCHSLWGEKVMTATSPQTRGKCPPSHTSSHQVSPCSSAPAAAGGRQRPWGWRLRAGPRRWSVWLRPQPVWLRAVRTEWLGQAPGGPPPSPCPSWPCYATRKCRSSLSLHIIPPTAPTLLLPVHSPASPPGAAPASS